MRLILTAPLWFPLFLLAVLCAHGAKWCATLGKKIIGEVRKP